MICQLMPPRAHDYAIAAALLLPPLFRHYLRCRFRDAEPLFAAAAMLMISATPQLSRLRHFATPPPLLITPCC